jgi:hypothetical protein
MLLPSLLLLATWLLNWLLLAPDQLLDAAHKMAKEGPDYIPQTKALYEELLKRIDDPARIAELKKQLADKVGAIEKGQTLRRQAT